MLFFKAAVHFSGVLIWSDLSDISQNSILNVYVVAACWLGQAEQCQILTFYSINQEKKNILFDVYKRNNCHHYFNRQHYRLSDPLH